MNWHYLIAGLLCLLLGVIHSLFGEYLIFKDKRKKLNLVPTIGNPDLKSSHLRIIWSTWHLASFFGWGIGAILIKIAYNQNEYGSGVFDFVIISFTYAIILGSLIVLIGTKGKHPGWIVLLVIALLLWIG